MVLRIVVDSSSSNSGRKSVRSPPTIFYGFINLAPKVLSQADDAEHGFRHERDDSN